MTGPEDCHYELLRVHNVAFLEGDHVATISNHICDASMYLYYINHNNVVHLSYFKYHTDVTYYYKRSLEKSYGLLRIIRTISGKYRLQFDLLRQKETVVDFDTGFEIKKQAEVLEWVQVANTCVELLSVFLNTEYLEKLFGVSKFELFNTETVFTTEQTIIEMTDAKCEMLLDQIFEVPKSNKQNVGMNDLLNETVFHLMNTHIVPESNSRKNTTFVLQEVENAIMENLRDMPSIDKLSRIAGMNRIKLQKMFFDRYGLTIYQYYQQKRFSYAKKLIEDKGYSVSETAYEIGYKHLGHFTNEFKKINGIRPSEIKKV